jgi:FtsH-binding integral membrane protein
VLFDTQLIVERASAGDFDVVTAALDLFTDFMAMAVRILIILLRNAEKKQQEEQRRRKRS